MGPYYIHNVLKDNVYKLHMLKGWLVKNLVHGNRLKIYKERLMEPVVLVWVNSFINNMIDIVHLIEDIVIITWNKLHHLLDLEKYNKENCKKKDERKRKIGLACVSHRWETKSFKCEKVQYTKVAGSAQ